MSAAFANAYKKLTYKVTKTKVEGDTATMNVDLKIPELASYFPEYFQKAMELRFFYIKMEKKKIQKQKN